MKKALIVAGLLVVAAAGWFFVSPLFIDRAVDEAFDFTGADGTFSLDKVMAMPQNKRVEMRDEIMGAAAQKSDQSMDEPMPASTPQLLARGMFVDADAIHKGSGDAKLYSLPDGSHAVRFENFRTTNGPALVVYLAKHANPQSAKDVTDGGFINLGKLKGNVGNQNYVIPPNTNVDDYGSVVIWCELFDVLFSPAVLKAT